MRTGLKVKERTDGQCFDGLVKTDGSTQHVVFEWKEKLSPTRALPKITMRSALVSMCIDTQPATDARTCTLPMQTTQTALHTWPDGDPLQELL